MNTADWPKVLADVTGALVNGEWRVSTADLVAHLGNVDAFDASMSLRRVMTSLGWSGPKTMRINGGLVKGYYRRLASELAEQRPEPEVANPPAEVELPRYSMPKELALQLERATQNSLQVLEEILALPTDPKSGNVLRAKTAAAGTVIQAQLRADETRLRMSRPSDTLDRLLKILNKQRRLCRPKKIVQAPATRSSTGG